MDGKKRILDSFKGFLDYSDTIRKVPPMWMTVGIVIWIGTFISVCPQVILLIRKRSSYGLNIITVIITSFGQFLMVIHYWCLHTADFVGLLQVPPRRSFARMLTFCNLITLWMSYLAVPFCCIIFMDFEERRNRSRAKIAKLWIMNIVLVLALIGSFFAMFIVYCLVGATRGPTVTRYDLELESGVKLTKLTNLANDLALSLGVMNVRIAPIPDKISTVGIEVPNKIVSIVYLRGTLLLLRGLHRLE